jgi:hypothetical protein
MRFWRKNPIGGLEIEGRGMESSRDTSEYLDIALIYVAHGDIECYSETRNDIGMELFT